MTDDPVSIHPAPLDGIDLKPLPDRLRQNAWERPDAPALVAGTSVTRWADLVHDMDRVAGWLAAKGVGRGDVVASVAGVSALHVTLYMGVLAAGACMAPLPTSAHPDAITAMRANCTPALVFADDAGREAAGPDALALDDLPTLIADTAQGGVQIAPGDLFDIIYSSGTTGAPKGITHDHLFRIRQGDRFATYGFAPDAVTLVSTPIYSNTTLSAMLPALETGGCLVLMEKFDAGTFLLLAQNHAVTHAMLVPVQYRRLLAHPDFDRTDLSSFRTKLSTSAPFAPGQLAEIVARWPGRLVNLYGMTEGGIGVMLDTKAHPDKLHTAGKPARGSEIRILGPDDRELPIGETGEIVGRSSTMMTGYRGDPEKTRATLWTSPEGKAFIRSGDMGRIDADGFLCLMDRTKDMINSGGFNIFPADLEAVLSDHPDVVEAAVVAISDPEWGETPMAFVVPKQGAAPDPDTLRAWANARLGKTQRIARLALRGTLPRNDIGKVMKRTLRALAEDAGSA